MSWLTLLGFCAGFLTTACWVPQVFRTWRTRTARDFSWTYIAMFTAGVAAWAVYGFLRHDVAVLAANAITLVLILVVATVKFAER